MNIIPLTNVRGDNLIECGVKGAQVGELMSIGLPVPNGFIVTTEAYADFMEDSELDEEIEEILSQVDDKLDEFSDVATNIQTMVKRVAIDGPLAKEILSAYRELGSEYVAVRSSTVVKEDPMIYYGGKLVTSLNIDEEELLSTIEYCWSSLYSARSLEYLFERDMEDMTVLVGIIVQEMVDAVVSGVCYTVDPKRKEEGLVVVHAGWGLGEAMVSGIVEPDVYVVNKNTFEVHSIEVGFQLKEVVREEDRHRIVDVPKARQKKQKLTEVDVLELARLSVQVEDYYGSSQQLEWAKGDDSLAILQTRAMS